MVAAEQWYEYNNSYKKHGPELKPREEKPVRKRPEPTVTLSDKAEMISLILIAGVLCLCLLVSIAYAANVRYEINTIAKENAALSGEIENLNVKIKNATNIRSVEEKAVDELGMIYPSSEQFVFLTHHAKPEGDFAMLLIERAYNN